MPQILSRTPDLEVHKVPDGYLIYQGNRDKVSYLNQSAAVVFEFCDCALDYEDVVRRASTIFGLEAAAQPQIRACVDSLIEEGLVRSSWT
jgi:hypothetical protein